MQLTKRDILARYRGSFLGLCWSFLTPLLMLAVYTFVFGVIFRARWHAGNDSRFDFALILFCGLISFNILAETLIRAPGIIVANPNYVKRVVFPLEVLPITLVCSALINAVASFIIVLIAQLIRHGGIPWTVVFLPLVIMPLLLLSLGLAWVLSSVGVFVRDIGQLVQIGISALLFLSPVFYPASAIPETFRVLAQLNPLSYVVEDARNVMLWGNMPHWQWLVWGMLSSSLSAVLGYLWFRKTRKGFADVI